VVLELTKLLQMKKLDRRTESFLIMENGILCLRKKI